MESELEAYKELLKRSESTLSDTEAKFNASQQELADVRRQLAQCRTQLMTNIKAELVVDEVTANSDRIREVSHLNQQIHDLNHTVNDQEQTLGRYRESLREAKLKEIWYESKMNLLEQTEKDLKAANDHLTDYQRQLSEYEEEIRRTNKSLQNKISKELFLETESRNSVLSQEVASLHQELQRLKESTSIEILSLQKQLSQDKSQYDSEKKHIIKTYDRTIAEITQSYDKQITDLEKQLQALKRIVGVTSLDLAEANSKIQRIETRNKDMELLLDSETDKLLEQVKGEVQHQLQANKLEIQTLTRQIEQQKDETDRLNALLLEARDRSFQADRRCAALELELEERKEREYLESLSQKTQSLKTARSLLDVTPEKLPYRTETETVSPSVPTGCYQEVSAQDELHNNHNNNNHNNNNNNNNNNGDGIQKEVLELRYELDRRNKQLFEYRKMVEQTANPSLQLSNENAKLRLEVEKLSQFELQVEDCAAELKRVWDKLKRSEHKILELTNELLDYRKRLNEEERKREEETGVYKQHFNCNIIDILVADIPDY